MLLDEPLTGLDRDLHDQLAVEMARLLRAAGTTALHVTHDYDEAAAVADRIVSLGQLGQSIELGERGVHGAGAIEGVAGIATTQPRPQ